jgi:hypothetical protein
VVTRRKTEKAAAGYGSGPSSSFDGFGQRLFGLFERASDVVDADATSVVLFTEDFEKFSGS